MDISTWTAPQDTTGRPDAIIVLPLEGRDSTHFLEHMNPRGRDTQLIELDFCSDIKSEQIQVAAKINTKTLLRAYAQRHLEAYTTTTGSHYTLSSSELPGPFTIRTPLTPSVSLAYPKERPSNLQQSSTIMLSRI